MKDKLEKARAKMDKALHILKLDVVKDVREAVDEMYQAVEFYELNNVNGKKKSKVKVDDGLNGLPLIGVAGQWMAAFVSGVGIGVELITKADVGYVTITCGALIFAFATKLKYYKSKR